MNKIKHLLFTLILVLAAEFCNNAFPQAPEGFDFEVITSENPILQKGLSANTVYTILQDENGYMWFGTWDGLNKYDGYNFITYDRKDGLSNEIINTLLQADDGNIWIGTDDGLNCFNPATEKVNVFKHNPFDSTSISSNHINFLLQDKPGRIIVCTDKGLNLFDLETQKAIRFQSRESGQRRTRSNNFNHAMISSDGYYWIATDFGLIEYNPETRENMRHLHRPGDPNSLGDNHVRFVYEDNRNRIWIGTGNGLSLINRKTNKFWNFRHDPDDPRSLSHNVVESLFEDTSGNFWVGTDGGGLNLMEPDSLFFRHVNPQGVLTDHIHNDRIYSIREDSQGNIWFGTFHGVSVWDRFKPRFNIYTARPGDPESLNSSFVWAFMEYRPNLIWMGTDQGISVFNSTTGKVSELSSYFTSENKLSSNRVRSLLKDSYGNVWIGTRDAGLQKLETKTGKIYTFQTSIQYRNSICDPYVMSIYEDKYGVIWVGTNGGLNTIDPVTHEIRVFKNDPGDRTSISSNTIYDFMEDRHGDLWIATLDGLNKFHRTSATFSSYKNIWHNENKITTDRLFSLYEDTDGNFWVGTRGGGLELFNRNTKRFKSYTVEDGLPNNVIYGILEDENGNLWMSTNWGISMFDKANESFVNFDVTDGLQSNEFNAGAYLRSSKGEMFFGGMRGFNMFKPEHIRLNPHKPEIVITSFKKFNKPQPGQLLNGDTIVLSHDENFFSFEFSSLDFTNALRSKYAYILEDYNRDWTYVDGRRHFAEYTNVSPGRYIFRVIGANSNGIWNNEGVSLTIIVKAPWYQTILFRIFLILMIIFLIWFVIYSRVKRIRRKHNMEKKVLKIEKQLFEIQQKALRLQMNPHFIFNSLNSIQSFILSRDIDLAVSYLSRFSQLMRLILSNSRESIIPLNDEIKAVAHYIEIERLRFDNKFDCTINIDDEIDEEFTGIPPMIIQPYVENSIIHGLVHKNGHGHITIDFKRKGKILLITITDDGIGRKRAMEIKRENGLETKSRGMMITRERLEILNSSSGEKFNVKVFDLSDDSGNPSGTRVELMVMWQDI